MAVNYKLLVEKIDKLISAWPDPQASIRLWTLANIRVLREAAANRQLAHNSHKWEYTMIALNKVWQEIHQ